jgi:uncharacterized protein (DUF58 family)
MTKNAETGVYANLHELNRLRAFTRGFGFLPKQPLHSLLAGRHTSKLRGRGLDFDEIRKYQPGDDIRQIDWKVTARLREPHARVFTEERERPTLLVVDQRLTMFFGSRRNFKSTTACEAAAVAAWGTIRNKDRVGAVLFDDRESQALRPERSQSSVQHLLGELVTMNQRLNAQNASPTKPGMLNQALEQAARLATHDHLVILISDGVGSDETTRAWVTRIGQHNDVLIVFVFDPLETDLPAAEGFVASDGLLQLSLDRWSETSRANFREEFAQHRAAAKHYLTTRAAPVLALSAAEPTLPQIARALGARMSRGRR